jgi:hypothetical protein
MPFAPQYSGVGAQPINFRFVSDTTQRVALGEIVAGIDAYWGGAEFIYLLSNDAVVQGSIVTWDNAFKATLVPLTANLAVSLAVAVCAAASGNYFWAFISGSKVPMATAASVAAGTSIGIGAAGEAGAVAAGKQILNAKSVAASTATVVIANAQTINNSTILQVSNSDGWFPGVALSGTGIAGGTTISSIASDGRTVTMSAAATATGSVSVTGTYTGYILAQMDRPFAQGAIT